MLNNVSKISSPKLKILRKRAPGKLEWLSNKTCYIANRWITESLTFIIHFGTKPVSYGFLSYNADSGFSIANHCHAGTAFNPSMVMLLGAHNNRKMLAPLNVVQWHVTVAKTFSVSWIKENLMNWQHGDVSI